MNPPIPSWDDFVGAWELFRDPVICGIAAGTALGLLGVHVVLRRMVFVAATLSQVSGLGVALAFYAAIHLGLDLPPVLGALLLSLLAAVLVRPEDLRAVLGVGAVVATGAVWARRGLVFAGFDPDGARVQGLPVRALDTSLLVAVTVMVAVSTRALGALPVFAFSVLPALAALLTVRHLRWAFPLAALLGGLSGGLGYLAAFFFSFPVGACQAVTAGAFVLLAVPVRLLRGGE